MRILAFAGRWLFILCLPVLLVTASVAWAINSLWLYEHGFEKYGISRSTGLAPADLDKAARGLISYFNSSEEPINVSVIKDGKPMALFNEREIVHLRDVKALFWLDYRAALVALAYIAGYAAYRLFKRRGGDLARAAFAGGALTLGLMLLMGVGILFDFDRLFLQFHLISFSNDFWQLDPSRDYLIKLFPQGFWNDAAMYIAIMCAGMAAVLTGVSARIKRRVATAETA
jgi:integral membrane protein (TIGR01906 family)